AWKILPSELVNTELKAEVERCTALANMAEKSDASTVSKLSASADLMALLSKTEAELDATIPSAGGAAGGVAGPAAAELAALRTQLLESMKSLQTTWAARTTLPNLVKTRFDRDAFIARLQSVPADKHAEVLEVAFSAPQQAEAVIDDNVAAEARTMEMVGALFSRFAALRSADGGLRAREEALQRVASAVDTFEELFSTAKEGKSFYRDLTHRVNTLLTTTQDFVAARGLQQREIMLHAETPAAAYAAAHAPAGGMPAYPTASQSYAMPVMPLARALSGDGASASASAPTGAMAGWGAPVAPSVPVLAPRPYAPPTHSVGSAGSVKLQQMVNMGFPADAAARALAENGDDIGRAVSALLDVTGRV
ncbi:MAG: hypothetical protein EOO41_03425, partial [Methanobacteriota archaeon]